ncbi:unnamed protein product, partial [Allacma fusca]
YFLASPVITKFDPHFRAYKVLNLQEPVCVQIFEDGDPLPCSTAQDGIHILEPNYNEITVFVTNSHIQDGHPFEEPANEIANEKPRQSNRVKRRKL